MYQYPFPLPEPQHGVAYPTTLEELEALRVFHGKFLRPQMLGIHSQNPFAPWNSPSRSVMTTQHLPQRLIVEGLTPPTIMTGLEYELSKYTIAERMPENGTVISVIPRYPARAGANNRIGFSPETTVIVEYFVEPEGDEPGYMTLDAIPIKQYTSYHQHFGFRNKPHPDLSTKLNPKERIPKGFAFTDTPAVKDNGCYATGIEPLVCFLDVPGTAEDSIIVRKGYLPQMAFAVYEEIEIGFGGSDVPLNLFGTEDDYKIFPDVGERAPKSGLLMAVRPVMERLGVATLGKDDLRKLDRIFDGKRYSREAATDAKGFMTTEPGLIIDVQVIKNTENPRLPPSMAGQLEDYVTALRMYYTRLLELETRLMLENKRQGGTGELKMSPRMTNLLVRARALTGHGSNRFNSGLVLQEHKAVLDEYTVKFTVEHRIVPNPGQKATCYSGGKGVISSIWEDEHMPRNDAGDVADIIMSSKSTIDRSNWGRNLYPYFANAARTVTKELRKRTGLDERAIEEQVELLDDTVFRDCFSYLLGFYAIVSPFSFWNYAHNVKDPSVLRKHLHACITNGVKCLMPIDNPINELDAILQLDKLYPQPYTPVRYKGEGCDFVTTNGPVRIAPLYMMSLEKIADDGSTTNIGKLQHHGLLASQTRSEKYSQPYRSNPTRNCGEAEGRMYLFYAKTPRAVAEMLDRSNNPATMRGIAKTFLTHETPTNIQELVNREIHRYNPRPLQFLRHFMVTQGFDTAYMPEKEAFDLGMREIFHAR